jgi:hypothetical protein
VHIEFLRLKTNLPLIRDNQGVDVLFHTAQGTAHQVRCSCSGILKPGVIRAVCFDMRNFCLGGNGLINSGCCQLRAVEADQNSFGGGLFGAECGILDEHWVARIRTGDSGVSTPVRSE